MPTLWFQAKRRMKNEVVLKYVCVFSALFSIFMFVGRTVAGVHWLTDIMGSILLSTGLFLLYRAVVLIIDDKAKICDMLFGIIDVLAMIMIVLPIYPNRIDGVYYAVSLPDYVQAGRLKCMLYWAVFILLVIIGTVKILLTRMRQERGSRIITAISVIVGITAVLLLAMGREAYGVSMLFLMIVAKGIVIYKMR